MTDLPKFEILELKKADSENGSLTVIEHGVPVNGRPFVYKRVFVISGMKPNGERGGHTHHETTQVLICLSGACTVTLDNGYSQTDIRLDRQDRCLVLCPYVWHTMHSFADNTMLLVLADTPYDESDYIRDYNEFLGLVKS